MSKSAETHERINVDVMTAIKAAGGTATKSQIVEATDHKPATVGAALKRLRSGDKPAVAMVGNKRGAKYEAAKR